MGFHVGFGVYMCSLILHPVHPEIYIYICIHVHIFPNYPILNTTGVGSLSRAKVLLWRPSAAQRRSSIGMGFSVWN